MFNKVLVPLDGSKLAECALPYLKKLASGGKVGEVILLTVAKVDIPYTDVGSGFDFQAFSSAALDKDRKYLAEGGLVDSVMKSRGGEIANDDTAENPKAEENQFDELVETGGLESHIDADQQQGNDQEDQDRRDIVSMVMNTRKKRG